MIFYKVTLKCIMVIVGPSGSGKTTMTNIMAENGIPTIVSYTTRPMREGETNGKEHWFVKPEDKPDESTMLAYTKFGGYEYWTTKNQVKKICTYIIDEKGLEYLRNKLTRNRLEDILIFSIYIDRDIEDRLNSGVDQERCDRDKDRITMDLSEYDYVIHNNYSLEEFTNKIQEITKKLIPLIK